MNPFVSLLAMQQVSTAKGEKKGVVGGESGTCTTWHYYVAGEMVHLSKY